MQLLESDTPQRNSEIKYRAERSTFAGVLDFSTSSNLFAIITK